MSEHVINPKTDSLSDYLEFIVQPTFEDYQRNTKSARHAFLACVAVFHCVDRVTYPKKSGNIRNKWRNKSIEFLVVDMFAHHLKHVRSSDETHAPKGPGLPLSFLAESMDFHNLYFAVRDSIKFIRQQVGND